MAAKWQQWMPFHIDKFRGSPAVQAMHPTARSGYLYLLSAQWQSEDGIIPADADLPALSGLGDELWAKYKDRILKCFVIGPDGEMVNQKCRQEWEEAKRVFNARKKAANRTNKDRWYNGDRSVTDRGPNRSANTITATATGTVTTTEKRKQKPSSAARKRTKKKMASPPTKTEMEKLRHTQFKAAIFEYWKSKNPGIDCPWQQMEGMQLEMWLKSSPNTTLPQFTAMLRNRYRSDVVHSERPSLWIRHITNYAHGPLNQYGKLKGNGNGTNGNRHHSKTSGNFDEARQAIEFLSGQIVDPAGDGETGVCIEGHIDPVRQ